MWYYWQCAMCDTEGSPVCVSLFKNTYCKMAARSRKFGEIQSSILSLFQGNMLYLIWVIAEEYLGCWCRWSFGTASQSLVGCFCMKFCLNLAHVHCGTMWCVVSLAMFKVWQKFKPYFINKLIVKYAKLIQKKKDKEKRTAKKYWIDELTLGMTNRWNNLGKRREV